MKKKLLAGLLITALSFSLVACGGGNTATTTKSGNGETKTESNGSSGGSTPSGTIKISWWGGDSRHEATQNAIKAFEAKNPDIKVEAEYGAWTGWEEAMSTKVFAGNIPDVNQINWSWINSFSADGTTYLNINDVSDIIDLTQFPEAALEACSIDDGTNLQAVPISMTGRIFFWNKTTYEKAGLETPKTLADLKAAGPVFKEKLGDDYYPLAMNEFDRMIFMVFYLQAQYGKEWVTDGVLNYSVEQLEEGLTFIQSLEDAHVIPSIKTLKGDGAESFDKNPKWIDGKYAGQFEWDSAATKSRDALAPGQEMVVGDYFADFGKFKGGFSKVSMAFAISAKTASPDACATLIQFLLNDPEGIELMGSERGIPLSKKAFEITSEKGLLDPMVADANAKVLAGTEFSMDPFFEDAKLKSTNEGVYWDALGGLSYGDYTPREAAEVLHEGITDVLES